MRLIRNTHAIGRLSLILLLLIAFTVGAFLSYLWEIGYIMKLGISVPEKPTVDITNIVFPYQDTSFFNVTIQCPTSYESEETAKITQIVVLTNNNTRVRNVTEVNPSLPYKFLEKGASETFKCIWNWASYTGETVGIVAFLEEGTGPTFQTETRLVNLNIKDARFNSTISVTHFNITVQNAVVSETYVNITDIVVTANGIKQNVTETTPIPWTLNPGDTQDFNCVWDWTDYQNTSVTVAVHTLQGYMNYTIQTTPLPVTLNVTEILFNVANTSYFSVNVTNNEASPTYVNITRIAVAIGNLTVREWTVENGTYVEPAIPYTLDSNSLATFVCPWNWTEHRDKNVTVVVDTLQRFTAWRTQVTPPPIILNITYVGFDPIDTNHFNITVQNSEFSLEEANITEVHVTIENIIVAKLADDTVPSLPFILPSGADITFMCSWNWSTSSGKDIIVTVETSEGYEATYTYRIP